VNRTLRLLTVVLVASVAGLGTRALAGAGQRQDRFDHLQHAELFPVCTTCHEGIVQEGATLFPPAVSCVNCHDGTIEERVEYQPRAEMRPGNLRFSHTLHAREVLERTPADSAALRCQSCHAEASARRMDVKHAVVGNCLDCHRLGDNHLDVPDTACATCHVPLPEARRLTRSDIGEFPEPDSHDRPDFRFEGHGRLARPEGTSGVAASCATCHAREFCITCHVNAPEVPAIQALALDERATAILAELPVPPSHAAPGFAAFHGDEARREPATCATCHTRESCAACHTGTLRQVAMMPEGGPGRGQGAVITRRIPPSHTFDFRERHGPEANARASSCEGCHIRAQCLDCHRPDPSGTPTRQAYHPQGFLTRHPAAAYSREANCTDCHNPGNFCQQCHIQSGLVSRQARIGSRGYHDAFPNFSLGHGQAARQSLESCASCHAERDCTACHSAVLGGFRFSPHGPGFNPDRMRKKNPTVCVACHGRAIPGGP
jgi:hypothetical protein